MGFAIAEQAARRGARVRLVAGVTPLSTPAGVDHLAKAIVSMLTDAGWPTDRLLPRPGTHPLSIGPDPHDGRPLPAEERVMSPLDNLFGSGNSLNPGR